MTITEGALIKRINRKLAKEWKAVRKARPHHQLGNFYILDTYNNVIESYGIDDLEDLGREVLGGTVEIVEGGGR